MGRHDQPVPDGRLAEFAKGLRDLRRRAGNPSYQIMARECGYPMAVLLAAASGRQLPPLTVTLAYVSTCGGDPGAWADRWRSLSARLSEEDHASLIDTGTHDPVPPEPAATSTRRRERVLLVLAGLVAIGLTAALLLQGRVSMPVDVAAWWTEEPVAPSTATGTPALTAAEPPPEYRAVTGPACPMDFTRQTHISSAPGDDGWPAAVPGPGTTATTGSSTPS
jgi:hypothetical protein